MTSTVNTQAAAEAAEHYGHLADDDCWRKPRAAKERLYASVRRMRPEDDER